MSVPKQQNSFPLRMPDELRARVERRASATGRSANSEIVAMLTAALDAESDLASISADVLLKELINRLGARVQIVVSKDAAEAAGISPGDTNKPVRRAAKK
jgi:plasmid stability protein